jgi:hypothetical protein
VHSENARLLQSAWCQDGERLCLILTLTVYKTSKYGHEVSLYVDPEGVGRIHWIHIDDNYAQEKQL